MKEAIVYKNVSKSYTKKEQNALVNVNASIHEGEFVTILGPSGCGKTTLLKMTNRLLEMDLGEIYIQNKNIRDMNPVQLRRNMGYVIQQVGLFPHMTIYENVTMIPDIEGWDDSKKQKQFHTLMNMVGLDPKQYGHRYPNQLSGGQQQRVGFVRALIMDPEIMLLDEPFGAVDALTRQILQKEIKKIHQNLKKTFLFVTHDIHEALLLGDRVMVIHEGQIVQFESPEQLVKHPKNAYVKELIDSAKDLHQFWESIKA